MKAVGIKLLKARLSEYLRLVKTGEIILVTERDEVVAELHPANRQKTAPATLEDGLHLLAEKGQATLRSESIQGWLGPQARIISLCYLLDGWIASPKYQRESGSNDFLE
jgi:antitoxin (DNA-binding transcriptional repressor) of toxin-antitoxin stability system